MVMDHTKAKSLLLSANCVKGLHGTLLVRVFQETSLSDVPSNGHLNLGVCIK